MTSQRRSTVVLPTQAPPTAWSETSLTAHEHIGFELGWDYARYRVQPPAPYGHEPSPLRHGLLAGQAAFGERTLSPRRR